MSHTVQRVGTRTTTGPRSTDRNHPHSGRASRSGCGCRTLADGRPAADHVVLRSVRDGEPFVVEAEQESSDEAGAWWSADLHVHNPLTSYRFLLTDGRSRFRWLNASGVHDRDVTDASDFRVSTEHLLPDWVEDQVGYQVFPDRFERTETGAPLPAWAIPADWDDPVLHRGPGRLVPALRRHPRRHHAAARPPRPTWAPRCST